MFNLPINVVKIFVVVLSITLIGTIFTTDWDFSESGPSFWKQSRGTLTHLLLLVMFSVDLVQKLKDRKKEK